MAGALATMHRIGIALIDDSKAAARATINGELHKSDWTRRDLLSLLVRANAAVDLPSNQKLNDEEVLARTHIYLPSICYCLYLDARNPHIHTCWPRNNKVFQSMLLPSRLLTFPARL